MERGFFLRLVVCSASLFLHVPPHQRFRSVDPQDDLIWRAMTKTRFEKTTMRFKCGVGGVCRAFFLSFSTYADDQSLTFPKRRCNYMHTCFGHCTVGAADAELARLRFFVCGVSDVSAVVLQCGGHEQAARMDCVASMWSRFELNWL